MKPITILPADIYTVVNKTVLSNIDRETIISLYEPIMGPIPTSLYFLLWQDSSSSLISIDFTHHHLMSLLKCDLPTIAKAREVLEALGLLKTYFKPGEINNYLYELYSPLSAFEFFNHPVLNVVLYNNLGKIEYELIKKSYEKPFIDRKDYQDITSSLDKVFKIVSEGEFNNEDLINKQTVGIVVENQLDFDYIISALPSSLVSDKTFNKKNKQLLNSLAFLYNLDNLKMTEIIRKVVDEKGFIDKEALRKLARNYYQFNNSGDLPTLVYRTQPEYLKNPTGDETKRGKILYVFENTSPYDFLCSKNKGTAPTNRDIKLIESLIVDNGLKPAVVNVLIDYVLKINNHKLNTAFVEAIAGQWQRLGIETASEAMSIAEKEHQKTKKRMPLKTNQVVATPVWFDEVIAKEDIDAHEEQELQDLLKEFR